MEASEELSLSQNILQFSSILSKLSHEDQELLSETLITAAVFHGSQRRKSGTLYIAHPIQVATLLLQNGAETSLVQAGLLHDVIEDTSASAKVLEERFGTDVSHLVELVSHNKFFSKKEFYDRIYQRSLIDPRIAWLKIADRCANLMHHSQLALSKESHESNLEETKEFYVGILATIPELPKNLIQLLKKALADSILDYNQRT
jgi:guanosine-3',5'-bis(diphosphate) 3'-pyrophosphohydrolase